MPYSLPHELPTSPPEPMYFKLLCYVCGEEAEDQQQGENCDHCGEGTYEEPDPMPHPDDEG